MDNWFCRNAGVEAGPFTFEELKYLVSRGKLQADDLVRHGELGNWNAASSIYGLMAGPHSTLAADQTLSPVVQETRRRSETTVDPEPANGVMPEASATPSQPPTPVPPPLLHDPESRRANRLLWAGVGALALLLLLLTLMWYMVPSGNLIAWVVSDGEITGNSRGGGSAPTDSQGKQSDGVAGGKLTPGSGGEKLEKSEQGLPQSNSLVEAKAAQSEQVHRASDDPEEGSATPLEELPSEKGALTIEKWVPQERNDADSLLGGGRAGGPRPEMFQGRDPETRAELIEEEGGSPESEEAVELGLKWLVDHQMPDGRWSLNRFGDAQECQEQCTGGGMQSDTAATGLALMPLLGAGYTHGKGKYKNAVRKGLDFLIKDQTETGTFASIGGGNMYAHGIASIALCEAYAMTKDKGLRRPAQRAIEYICLAQHPAGGWRYSSQMPGDTSVMGWQILPLKSAQAGGLAIPKDVFLKANRYLDSVQADKPGGTYGYMPIHPANPAAPTPSMSAEALLCRMYCGWPKDEGGLRVGVQYLLNHKPDQNQPNIYYWYYATQVLHHYGGDPWRQWNEVMRDTLIDTQVQIGHERGSWRPIGGHSAAGGRLYMTSLALCTLEVYYRHAALFD